MGKQIILLLLLALTSQSGWGSQDPTISAPENFTVAQYSEGGNAFLLLEWNSVEGATGYLLYHELAPDDEIFPEDPEGIFFIVFGEPEIKMIRYGKSDAISTEETERVRIVVQNPDVSRSSYWGVRTVVVKDGNSFYSPISISKLPDQPTKVEGKSWGYIKGQQK